MSSLRVVLSLVAAVLLLGGGGAGSAAGAVAGKSYTAALTGGGEVPPRATPAGGEATFRVSDDGQALAYTVTVRDIANVTAGHIHLGAAGANGDIVLPLVPSAAPGGGPRSGVIAQGTATAAQLIGPLQGKGLADLLAAMDAGTAYVNIHTATGTSPAALVPGDFPPGEIRGQIGPAPSTAPGSMPATGGGFGGSRGWPRPGFVVALPLALLAIFASARFAARRAR